MIRKGLSLRKRLDALEKKFPPPPDLTEYVVTSALARALRREELEELEHQAIGSEIKLSPEAERRFLDAKSQIRLEIQQPDGRQRMIEDMAFDRRLRRRTGSPAM